MLAMSARRRCMTRSISVRAARREVDAHRPAVVVVDAAADEFLVDEPVAYSGCGRRADVELIGQRSHRL